MFSIQRFFPVLVIAVWLAACGGARAQSANFDAPVPAQGVFLPNIPYGPSSQEVLDVCRPAETTGLHPGIIMIHGGGWIHGDKRGAMDRWCQRFARLGYVVANIDYRLASKTGPVPDWPEFQIGDTQLAIRWMRAHAGELGLDPSRLCAYGTSAGAYLAVFAATLQRIGPSDVAAIAPSVPVTLSCLVDGFGPVDLEDPRFSEKAFAHLIGVPYQQNPTFYHDDSPLFYVTAQTPPTLIIHGNADTIVPIAQSEELQSALKRENVPVQLITYDGNHAYKGLDSGGLNDIFEQIAAFFKSHIGGAAAAPGTAP